MTGDHASAEQLDTSRQDGPLDSFTPIPVTRLADGVVEQIRQLILDQTVEVGDRLPSERSLAEQFGTSRAIVSQALRSLSLMGLVEIRPGSGAYVIRNARAMMSASMDLLLQMQQGEPTQIAELRHWLESTGAAHALDRHRPEDADRLEESLMAMESSRDGLPAWIVADARFHATLVEMSGNGYLSALYESVHTSVISVTYDAWVQQGRAPRWFVDDFDAQIALHEAIFDAFRQQDAARLTDALDEHQRVLIEHLEDSEPS